MINHPSPLYKLIRFICIHINIYTVYNETTAFRNKTKNKPIKVYKLRIFVVFLAILFLYFFDGKHIFFIIYVQTSYLRHTLTFTFNMIEVDVCVITRSQ